MVYSRGARSYVALLPTPYPTPRSYAVQASIFERRYTWGADDHGQLGQARRPDEAPALGRVRFPASHVVVTAVAAGWRSSACVDSEGRAWAWGEAPRAEPCLRASSTGPAQHRGWINAPGLLLAARGPPPRGLAGAWSRTLSVLAADDGADGGADSLLALARARTARLLMF